jgi:hypothetical protein
MRDTLPDAELVRVMRFVGSIRASASVRISN